MEPKAVFRPEKSFGPLVWSGPKADFIFFVWCGSYSDCTFCKWTIFCKHIHVCDDRCSHWTALTKGGTQSTDPEMEVNMEVLHAALLHFLIKHCENDRIFVCLFKKLDNVGFCPNIQEAQCLLVAPCLSTAHCSM